MKWVSIVGVLILCVIAFATVDSLLFDKPITLSRLLTLLAEYGFVAVVVLYLRRPRNKGQ